MKKILSIVLVTVLALTALAAFAGCSQFSDKYAIADVTLVGTNANHPNGMKGFSMQGTISEELLNGNDVLSVAMCFTTADKKTVENFFTTGDYKDETLFLALIDQLDVEGKIRNLAGDKRAYLDGKINDPITFYGDAVDLISGKTLFDQAGEYHFYLVVCGETKVLWVGEADKTFAITQEEINLAKEFKDAAKLIVETRLEDYSADSPDGMKAALVKKYFEAKIAAFSGMTIAVEKDTDPNYPDDYKVTLTKNGQSNELYVTVYFGPASDADLFSVKLVRSDTSYENMKAFQLGFKANTFVTEENTKGYIIFYSTSDYDAVVKALENKTFDDIDAMDLDGKVKLITDLTYADGAGNTYYGDALDLISGECNYAADLAAGGVTYHFYVATISTEATNVVRFVVEADSTFTFPVK